MAKGEAVHSAHQGPNQQFTITGVIGTQGTADLPGTALTLPIGVEAATGAMFVQDLSGAAGTTVVEQVTGTITTGSLSDIAFIHEIGTMPAIAVGESTGGTLDTIGTLGSIANVGAIHTAGTVSALPDLPGGTMDELSNIAGGTVEIQNNNLISSNNSTTGTLAGDAAFTGVGDDITKYAGVTIQLDSSHDSATDGMTFQFSTDDSNWDDINLFTYTAANGARRFQFPSTAQYFRVVYTNGATDQTHLRIQTILHRTLDLTSIHRLTDDTNPDRSAEITKSAIMARTAGAGDFKVLNATAAANLKVSVEEFDSTAFLGTVNQVGTNLGMGTLTEVGQVHDAGTIAALPDLPGGTVDLVTSVSEVANLAGGTFDVGTVVVSAINDDLNGGTIDLVTAVSSVSNLVKGTITKVEGGTIGLLDDLGSVVDVAQVHNAGTVAALPDLPGGTVDAVTNVAGGTIVSNTPYSYSYHVAGTVNGVVKNAAGFLHAIVVGDAVASSTIEVSDHASDGDGAVVLMLAGDTIGPAVYPVNMTMGTGITTDIVNQTKVTFIYK